MIFVADLSRTGAAAYRGVFQAPISTEGAQATIVVNLDQVKTLAGLTAALAAAASDPLRDRIFRQTVGVLVDSRQDPRFGLPGMPQTGPFGVAQWPSTGLGEGPRTYQYDRAVIAFSFTPGLPSGNLAQTRRVWTQARLAHAVAILVDTSFGAAATLDRTGKGLSASDQQRVFSEGIPAVIAAMTGELPA